MKKSYKYLVIGVSIMIIISFIGYEALTEPEPIKSKPESFLKNINSPFEKYNFSYYSSHATYYVYNCSVPANEYIAGTHTNIQIRIVETNQSLSFPLTGISFNLSDVKYYINNSTCSNPSFTIHHWNSTIVYIWSFSVLLGNNTYKITGYITPVYEISFMHFNGIKYKFESSHRLAGIEP